MRTRRHTLIPAEGWETGALEAWLEDEAAKGWRLADSGSRLAAFDRAEPARCRVRLHSLPPSRFSLTVCSSLPPM